MYNIVRFFISFPSPQNTMALKIYNIKINHETNTENGQKKEKKTKLQYSQSNVYNYITSVFHWNVTIYLVMKWSHDYKRDVSHPNETQIRTCMCLHDDIRCKQSMA